MQTPIPSNESARLDVLRSYQVLDTPAEAAYDNITRLAASVLNTPIALVCLIDERRQWFKSRHGLKPVETPRSYAICAHAILGNDVLVVEDASADARFCESPLVVGEPFIRFYAGAPLIMRSGFCIGTLCLIDTESRQASQRLKATLRSLRDMVVTLLEHRLALTQLESQEQTPTQCAWCKSFRSLDDGSWESAEEFLAENYSLTHGICPDCLSRDPLGMNQLRMTDLIPPVAHQTPADGKMPLAELLLKSPLTELISREEHAEIDQFVAINGRRALANRIVPVAAQRQFLRGVRTKAGTAGDLEQALHAFDQALRRFMQ